MTVIRYISSRLKRSFLHAIFSTLRLEAEVGDPSTHSTKLPWEKGSLIQGMFSNTWVFEMILFIRSMIRNIIASLTCSKFHYWDVVWVRGEVDDTHVKCRRSFQRPENFKTITREWFPIAAWTYEIERASCQHVVGTRNQCSTAVNRQ